MISTIVPVARGVAAALVYAVSSSATLRELARLVFFACVLVLVYLCASTPVRL